MAPHKAPASSAGCAESCEVYSLFDMDLAILIAFSHAGVFEIDQILLLHRSQLIQHLVGSVHAVEVEYDQIAHDFPSCSGSNRPVLGW